MSNSAPGHHPKILERFLHEFLLRNQNKYISVLLFAHRQADADALCSAYALAAVLEEMHSELVGKDTGKGIQTSIIAPKGASVLATNISRKLGISFVEEMPAESINDADLIAVLDVGEPELLSEALSSIQASKASKILIDHHGSLVSKNGKEAWDSFDIALVDSHATSTCEIVALEFDSKLINRGIARALMTGLLFDSQHLGIANESTLEAALKLTRAGAMVDETRELLRSRPDRSELIARLKSAQRLHFSELGPYLLAESEVSSFHAAVARMLLDIGADVSIAYGTADEETRVSSRSTQRFFRETGIDLGMLLTNVAATLGIIGGGHSTAASISGRIRPASIVLEIKNRIEKELPKT